MSLKQIITKLLVFVSAGLMACILSSFLLLPTSLHARDQALNFNQQIERLKTAKKVAVILHGTPIAESEEERNESYNAELLRSGGCNFVSNQQSGIADFTTLLRKNHVKPNHESNPYMPYFGVSVYFTFEDGQEMRLLLGRRYKGESTVDGKLAAPPYFKFVQVQVDNTVYRDIYNWIAHLSKIEANSNNQDIYGGPYQEVRQLFLDNYIRGCMRLMHANYYRNSPQQTCSIPESERKFPDLCEAGWQPDTQN